MTFDLAIIGGGPAGCAAAITAARSGASVILFERGRFPRHKVCGEFVSAESLDLLRALLAPRHLQLIDHAPPIQLSRIFLDRAELSAQILPPAVSIPRFNLDSALWESAIAAGVHAHEDCSVKDVESGEAPFGSEIKFVLTTASRVFEARAVVNATGRWSNLTSPAIRACAANERWIGIKSHFHERSPSMSVDLYFFDGGYCGVQPVALSQNGCPGKVNACAMVRADVATTMEDVLRQNAKLRERSMQWAPATDPVTTSQLIFHKPEPEQAGMLQVGDAATFVDPFIGDGISLALRSGDLAAECLAPFLREECSLDHVRCEYRRLYQERLAPVFRASSKLRALLKWPGLVRKPVLSILQRTPSVTNLLVKMTR